MLFKVPCFLSWRGIGVNVKLIAFSITAFVEQDNKEWNPLLQEILEGVSTTGLSM